MAPTPPDSIVGISMVRIRPIFKVPNLIGEIVARSISNEYLQQKFGLSEAEAAEMIRQLQALGYLSKPDKDRFYTSTNRGKLFGLEKSNKPITLEKADMLYAGILERIKIVNESPDFILKVSGYSMWGDYVNGSTSLKTIEMVLAFEHKDADTYKEKMHKKWDAHRSYLGIPQRYALPQTEIRKYLKARSPYISIYLPSEQRTLAGNTEKYFDAGGNYLYSTYQERKQPKQQSSKQSVTQNSSTDLVGRLLFNERTGKSSKKQIVRKYTEKDQELENIHGQILDGMVAILRKMYPECTISPECIVFGLAARIDIVRKTKDGLIILYEIKTYPKSITSIRMALGQLFEYAFYPDRKLSRELYIVSHVAASAADLNYLQHVEGMLGIKIGYLHFNCETNQIESK
jgi:hypothetical protein